MPYDNSGRADAARRTRARVIAAAHERLVADGWAGTTIRAVAQTAAVSPETIYKAFGSKAGLLKAVYDGAMAGDDDPVPMRDRPLFMPLRQATSASQAAHAYASIVAHLADQVGPLLRVALSSRGAEPELQAFADKIDAERLAGVRMVVNQWHARGWIRTGLGPDRAADVVWTLISPAVHELLLTREWSSTSYREWLEQTLLATVLTD